MSSREQFDRDLARLNEIRANPDDAGATADLRRALAARSNLVVSRAAEIVGEWELAEFVPELKSAFDHFLLDAVRRDPTCAAKFAIAGALNRLEVNDAEVFLRGARHVQMEPVWGGRVDTAAALRAACALGLARSDPPETMLVLADLLADAEADARIGAIRGIAFASRPGGAALLWYKARIGDAEPGVRYECYSALLALEPVNSLELVRERAAGDEPATAEAAILALGHSRLHEALPVLIELRDRVNDPALCRTMLTAIAALRSEAAFAFLLDLLANGGPSEAAEALDALAVFREDERRSRKIDRALRKRADLSPDSPYSPT